MFSKKILICLAIFALLLSPLIVWGATGYGIDETATAAGLTKTAAGDLPVLIGKILGTGLSLVGVLFFALMLYGGLTWMLARGNTEQETKALNTITAAIIGIVIVLASYAITSFVFKSIGPGSSATPAPAAPSPVAPSGELCSLIENKLAEKCSVLSDKATCSGAKPAELCDWGADGPCSGLVENGTDFCAGQTKTGVGGEKCGGYDFCE